MSRQRRTVTLAPLARFDLVQLRDYLTVEAGKRVSDGVLARIEQKVARLAESPEIGAVDDALGPGSRRLIVSPYLIVYEVRPEVVRVLRIVHGARDLPALFGG